MRWKKYSIHTTSMAEDFLMGILQELPVGGVEIEDRKKPTKEEALLLGDYTDDLPEDDGKARVSFYMEESQDPKEVIEEIYSKITFLKDIIDFGEMKISESLSDEEEWIDNWKKYFTAFEVEDILIVPSWEEPPASTDKVMIRIDPGVAFGTGTHESTQLAIAHLKERIQKEDQILDIGCGSGILSMIALKLGASYADCIDIDELALVATRENMNVNGIAETYYKTYQGDLTTNQRLQKICMQEKYDIVFANILAEIIIPMVPYAKGCLKRGGYYITSGIISHKEEEVATALVEAGLEIVQRTYKGEWVSILARRGLS